MKNSFKHLTRGAARTRAAARSLLCTLSPHLEITNFFKRLTRGTTRTRPTIPIDPEPYQEPKLPFELILLILEDLSVPELQACALVCRAWRYPSQKHLFSTLRLLDIFLGGKLQTFGARCIKWQDRLEESPHLATYLSRLHISSVMLREKSDLVLARNIAPKLSHLQSLHIWGGRLGEQEAVWYKEFVAYLKPSIRSLWLFRSYTWDQEILSMPGITSLSVHHPGVCKWDTSTPAAPPILGNLKRLELSGFEDCSSLLDFFISPSFDFANLRHLELDFGWRTSQPMSPPFVSFLDKMPTLMDTLVISLPPALRYDDEPDQFSFLPDLITRKPLSRFQHLQRVAITVSEASPRGLAMGRELLHTLDIPELRELSIALSFHSETVSLEKIVALGESSEWKVLDDYFSDRDRFRCLERFEVTKIPDHALEEVQNPDYVARFRDMVPFVEEQMPVLSERRMLYFVVATKPFI
ncbi:hypothetical protein VKT23_013274 [Stygiomarasmius scandens]|uniref:F-box domain-containing protein n=1 Tax=Marasmiellus scandens TaxID=2682957 RepID=A0ABR1J423_9AGAR